jgi:hypothetical protein
VPAGDDRGRAGRRQEPPLRELFAYIDDRPGSSAGAGALLPYGEGIAFWALGEIVKAECGILESDSPQAAEAKLERALPPDDPTSPGSRRARPARRCGWRARLAGGGVHRLAALLRVARRRRAERARVRGSALGDEALLAFLEQLSEWAEGVPLLVLCTARPELYERHATFGRTRGTRTGSTSRRSPTTRPPVCSPCCSSGRCSPPRRSRRCSDGRAAIRCMRRSSCACWPTAASSPARPRCPTRCRP